MAASVNNIAATFAYALSSSDSNHHHHYSASATSAALSITSSATTVAGATGARPISASWNPHSSLPLSSRSSLLSLYGLPGPLRRPHPSPRQLNIVISFLDDTDTVRPLSVSSLSPPRRKYVLLSVPDAFLPSRPNPSFSPESLVRKACEFRRRGAGTVRIMSANDVFVIRAWRETLGAVEGGLVMLSDPEVALTRAVEMEANFARGFGVRSERFLIVTEDGTVKALFASNGSGGEFDDRILSQSSFVRTFQSKHHFRQAKGKPVKLLF